MLQRRYSLQLFKPLVGDLNGLDGLCVVLFSSTHCLRVHHDVPNVVSHESVHDVEEVRAAGEPCLWAWRREVPHELFVGPHLRPQVLNRQLVVHWHVDGLDLAELHERLRAREDFLEKVFVPVNRKCYLN